MDTERERARRDFLWNSPHHSAEFDKRHDVLITSAGIAEVYGCTPAAVRAAVKADRLAARFNLRKPALGRIFGLWQPEIAFINHPDDNSFDQRMRAIDAMVVRAGFAFAFSYNDGKACATYRIADPDLEVEAGTAVAIGRPRSSRSKTTQPAFMAKGLPG